MKFKSGEKEYTVNFSSEYPLYDLQNRTICCNVHLKAPPLNDHKGDKRPGIDLVAIVDRSGSMAGSKMNLVKQTLCFMIEELEENDRLGVIDYGDDVDVVFPLTKMSDAVKKKAMERVNQMKTHGCTNLSEALLKGLDMMRERLETNEISSVLLLTDGQANAGLTETFDIVNMIKGHKPLSGGKLTQELSLQTEKERELLLKSINYKKKDSSIGNEKKPITKKKHMKMPRMVPSKFNNYRGFGSSFNQPKKIKKVNPPTGKVSFDYRDITTINTFGFGKDVEATMLKDIAQTGNGVYYYIDNNEVISETFVNCIGGLLSCVGKNIQIHIKPMNDCKIQTIFTDFQKSHSPSSSSWKITIPDIQAEEKKDIFFVIDIPKIDQSPKNFKFELINVDITFSNTITRENIKFDFKGVIGRFNEKVSSQDNEINLQLDEVRNRLLCSNALLLANSHAMDDNFQLARSICFETIKIIESSNSHNQKEGNEFSKSLIDDLKETIKNNLVNRNKFLNGGQQDMINVQQGHGVQRVGNFKRVGHLNYMNMNRARMYNRMASKMSKKPTLCFNPYRGG